MTDCCGSALRNDRLIQIFVGEESTPYLVQETILANLSAVFKRALENEDKFGGPEGVLKFPEDNKEAWRTLLCWRIRGKLSFEQLGSAKSLCHELVQCWIVGDKYGVKDFQDEIMWELLHHFRSVTPDLPLMKLAFENTPPGSPLRILMAEELAFRMQPESSFDFSSLDCFNGLVGFTGELIRVLKNEEHHCVGGRLEDLQRVGGFMVGSNLMRYLRGPNVS